MVEAEKSQATDPFRAALENVPQAPTTTYGKAEVKLAQANVSDLKSIKKALKTRPAKPDFEAALLSVATAMVVAHKLLRDGNAWKLPSSWGEIIVLFASSLTAYAAVAKYIKAFSRDELTDVAIQHVDDLLSQVNIVETAESRWWQPFVNKVAASWLNN